MTTINNCYAKLSLISEEIINMAFLTCFPKLAIHLKTTKIISVLKRKVVTSHAGHIPHELRRTKCFSCFLI